MPEREGQNLVFDCFVCAEFARRRFYGPQAAYDGCYQTGGANYDGCALNPKGTREQLERTFV